MNIHAGIGRICDAMVRYIGVRAHGHGRTGAHYRPGECVVAGTVATAAAYTD
jgi:hypothetical protein